MWNSKPKSHDCDCRRRTYGNPKYARGVCDRNVRPAVTVRIEGKRLVRAWVRMCRAGIEPDDIE